MQGDSLHSLKTGSIINNFKIIRVLGAGGFGITYLAEDLQLGMQVVIKEYFPNEFAIRKNDSTIIAKTSSSEEFSKGLQRFKEEAKTLARFSHPSIVKILGYFEANQTGYFVMEYEEGIDLAQYIKQKNVSLNQEDILGIIMPILEGLKEVHAHNFLHRDIKPGNILLRDKKGPVLIDFGASKLALGEASKSITSMLTEGYAPLEQYSTNVKQQGPFTDLYAVGAVIYKMITKNVPPSAQTRSYDLLQDGRDPFEPLQTMKLSSYDINFLKAVDRTLSIKAKDRPQSVKEFQIDISGKMKSKVSEKTEKLIVENSKKTDQKLSQEKFKNLNRSRVKIPERTSDNLTPQTHEHNVPFIKKNRITLMFVAVVIAIGIFEYSKNKSVTKGNNKERIIKTHIENDAMDSYDDQMGWGKAQIGINIEPVNVKLGKMTNIYSDDFKYPKPAVELAVKNIGMQNLRSFGIWCTIKDLDNKRVLGTTGQASGPLEIGWTSKKRVLALSPNDYAKVMQSNKPIDFTMSIDVYIKVKDGSTIQLYNVILTPVQLKDLHEITY